MLRRLAAVLFLLAAVAVPTLHPADAAETEPAITGLYLTTQYPAMTVRIGQTATVDLALHNFNLPPQRMNLSVPVVADGWTATLLGGGQPVGATMVAPNSEQSLQLQLKPPAGVKPGDYRFIVAAHGDKHDLQLPLTLTVRKAVPAKLKLTTDLPALRGAATTDFKFTITVANDSGRDANIHLSAAAPKNFQVNFTQAYGTQQITTLPIKAGKSKQVDASVTLPHSTRAGTYKLSVAAKSEEASAQIPLSIAVTGQPRLTLSGEGGRLSATAYAGQSSELTAIVGNDGSEAARDIAFSATAPEGWKTRFDPKKLSALPAGKTEKVKVTLTPSPRAIAGDYQVTLNADAGGGNDKSSDFRITVLTSTLWGAVGIGIIAAALLVVVFAVARFGRR